MLALVVSYSVTHLPLPDLNRLAFKGGTYKRLGQPRWSGISVHWNQLLRCIGLGAVRANRRRVAYPIHKVATARRQILHQAMLNQRVVWPHSGDHATTEVAGNDSFLLPSAISPYL